MDRDQFYTVPEVAQECFSITEDVISQLNITNPFFLEPSAGNGSFYNLMPEKARLGIDIDPKHEEVQQADYLIFNFNIIPRPAVVCGNPPFGFHCDLAIQFINISSYFADVIAFIVPASFNRYYYQRRLEKDLHLIKITRLPEKCFIYKNRKVTRPSAFMIWSKELGPFRDLRERKVETSHPDFEMVYCRSGLPNKPQDIARAQPFYKNKKFCFGVINAAYIGAPDAGELVFDLEEIRNAPPRPWTLFYTNDLTIKARLLSIDFPLLFDQSRAFIHSGFAMNDVIKAYNNLYPIKNKSEQLLMDLLNKC